MSFATPLSPGLVLENRYEIAQFLGYGGFGRTYLARDRHRFNEFCLLKEFAPQIRSPEVLRKAEELFQREAGILYQLRHPQIPEFRALLSVKLQGQEAVMLVEQFIAGVSYEQWIDQGHRLSEPEAVQFLRDLLPVLTYIHDRGVIHRDISPDNLIRERSSNKPYLIDFGSVRQVAKTALQLSGLPASATQIHKPGFSPREQLYGDVSPSTDLYSLAVTTLVLMTGRSPLELYDDQHDRWLWRQYLRVSPTLGAIFDRCLASTPNQRYRSAREVEQALAPISASSAINSASIAPVPPAAPPSSPLSRMNTVAVSPANRTPATVVPTYTPSPAISPPDPAGMAASSAPPVSPRSPGRSNDLWWMLLRLPLRLIRWAFKLLGFGFKTIDFVMTWIWRFVLIAVLILVGMLGSFLWKLNLWPSNIQMPSLSLPKLELPKLALPKVDLPNPLASKPKSCSDAVLYGHEKLGISKSEFYSQINRRFYDRHPELDQRPLTDRPEDAPLRQEWCSIAEKLVNQAN